VIRDADTGRSRNPKKGEKLAVTAQSVSKFKMPSSLRRRTKPTTTKDAE
jgi:nucleoid DNA-binding protein